MPNIEDRMASAAEDGKNVTKNLLRRGIAAAPLTSVIIAFVIGVVITLAVQVP